MKIKTSFYAPPIPVRNFDWSAWYDDLGEDGSPIGHGETEAAAISDLVDNYDAPTDSFSRKEESK
jgi:hypothetical protein